MTGARWGLLALLVLAPLPFGSVQSGAVLGIEVAAALLAAAALVPARPGDGAVPARLKVALAAWAGVLIVAAVQLVPAPASLVAALAPETARLRAAVAPIASPAAGAPLSLSPADTWDAALRWTAFGLVGAAAALAFRTERGLRRLAAALAISGTFQALYGSGEYLSGHQHIFGYAKKYMLDSATGTFINRNHFASYLAACLPFAMAIAWGTRRTGDSRSWLRRLADIDHPEARRRLGGLAAAVALWAGVLLSVSRAGLALASLATVLYPLLVARGRRAMPAVITALLLPVAALLLWQDVRSPVERLVGEERVALDTEARLPVWRASLDLIAGAPALGAGFGAFEALFSLHQPPGTEMRWDHAHNDWIEAAVDGGLVTPALLLVLVGAAAAGFRRAVRRRDGTHPFRIAAGVSVTVLAVHALVDFPLRIPAIALTLSVGVGLLLGSSAPGLEGSASSRVRAIEDAGR